MARPRSFTDEEFQAAYAQAEDMQDLAARLGVSSVSAYKHCKRLNLSPVGSNDIGFCLRLFHRYRGARSLGDLASYYKISLPSVRNKILQAISFIWMRMGHDRVPRNLSPDEAKLVAYYSRPSHRRFPRPRKIQYIKIFHLLRLNDKAMDDPAALATVTTLPLHFVNRYIQDCMDEVRRRHGQHPSDITRPQPHKEKKARSRPNPQQTQPQEAAR